MTGYRLRYHLDVATRDLRPLDERIRTQVRRAIEERLATAPESHGKPLRHTLKGLWSLRVGDYRVIYRITSSEVLILKIGHRKEAYEGLGGRIA